MRNKLEDLVAGYSEEKCRRMLCDSLERLIEIEEVRCWMDDDLGHEEIFWDASGEPVGGEE